MGVLSGYRVLDCTIAMAGPFAAQRLGDLGADVVKIEPVAGEWQRHVAAGGARGNKINVSFLSLNRNKRSLAVDLKRLEGKTALLDLVRTTDVFLQNYQPGVAARLGVDYELLAAVNPKLVYVSMSGYGESGPYVDRPGQDLILQGLSGAMLSAGRASEPPVAAGQYTVDAVTASTAFEAVLAALLHRERTGEGQLVSVNMLDAITTLQMQELSVFTVSGKPQERSAEPHAHVYIRAPYGAFATKDSWEWKISGLSGRQREISCCLEPAVQHCCANYRDAVGSSGRPSHTLLLGHARIGDFIHTAFRARC